MDKEKLRQFYFSTSSSFGAYKTVDERKSKRSNTPSEGNPLPDVAPTPTATAQKQSEAPKAHDVSLSAVDMSMPSTINDDDRSPERGPATQTTQVAATQSVSARGGTGVSAARAIGTKKVTSPTTTGATATKEQALPAAASPGYFNFLKQQQELQKQHNRIESSTLTLETDRRNRQAELLKLRRESKELLKEIELSTNWSLHSKYDVQQLIRDSTLSLQPIELVEDRPPQLTALQLLSQQLERVKSEKASTAQYQPHALFVDQGLRRISLLQTTLKDGNMDYTTVARIPDTLLVQLSNVCALPTPDAIITKFEEAIDLSTFKVEEAKRKREEAISDGEVHIAEKMCYEVLQHHEDMLEQIIAKIQVFEDAIKENTVCAQVNEQYLGKTAEEFERIRVKMAKLRVRCEGDLAKMFSLRAKVEEVEAHTAKKVQEEVEKSDVLLQKNAEKLDVIFVKMEELERELEVLERERHQLIQKRVQEKDKDEHRKAEYAQFCSVLEAHTVPLERTIRNMDLMTHSTEVLQEFVNAGFTSIREDLKERGRILRDVKLESHKQHVEVMRGLTVELGDIVYRKERMVEETDKNIQQAHIQQELLAETFNPNAKKFGAVKKRLLLNRDELETDVKELKERAETALRNFDVSENALHEAGVEFVHPVTEQQYHTLALRTKMMEFKAVIAGQTQEQPMLQELEALKAEVASTQAELEAVNASTSGTMSKSLPMIRAAMRSRQAKQ